MSRPGKGAGSAFIRTLYVRMCEFLCHPSHTCVTMIHVDTTIRNLDEQAYRGLKARAALLGKTVGELINEAIQAYLNQPDPAMKRRSLREWEPEPYPPGNERLSEEVDEVVYLSKGAGSGRP